MVSTRSKRRSISEEASDNGEDARLLNPEQAETALKEEEASLCRKKRKIEAFKKNHPPLELILVPEITVQIMSFFDNCRDVYNFAKCSKSIRAAVTSEIVIRSAVFAGGKARQAISNVMKLVQEKAIHTPSTLRLLRLVNARQCERLTSCCGYNLKTRKPEIISKSSQRPFGLAICPSCSSLVGSSAFTYRSGYSELGFLAVYKWTHMLCQPQTEATTGKPVGAIVLYEKFKQVQHTFKEEEDRVEALKKLHETLSKELLEDKKTTALVETYVQAESEYDAFEQAKREIREKKEKAKVSARADKKKESVSEVLKLLDAGLKDYAHKSAVLSGTFDEGGYYKLAMGPSRAIFGQLLSAPSSASQKRIQMACESIGEVYDSLASYGLLATGSNFLWGCESFAVDANALAIFNFCKKQGNAQTLFKNSGRKLYHNPVNRDESFVRLLQKGKVPEALFCLLNEEEQKEAFVDYASENEEEYAAKFRQIADNIYPTYPRVESLGSHRERFEASLQEYILLSQNFKDYLAHGPTRAFLALPEGEDPPQFTRQDAVDTVLHLDSNQKWRLHNRSFAALLALHRQCYREGRRIIRWY